MDIAKIIDHTNINHDATAEDIKKTCDEAKEYGFRGVDVRPKWVSLVKEELKDTDMKVIVLIDDPMGLSSHEERIAICKKVKEDGADELDVVMNIVDLKYERYDKVLEDLKEICEIGATKVIIGSGFLTDKEIKKASELVKEAGAICVKTATSKDPIANRELKEKALHVKLMKESAPGLLVKASGKIGNYQEAKMMVEAGADIIGASGSINIVKTKE